MSSGNGHDVHGEIQSIRSDQRSLDERHSALAQRLSDTTSKHWTLMDRVAVGLGRIDALEQRAGRIEKMIEALMMDRGLPVPP